MNMDLAIKLAGLKATEYCQGKPGERAYNYSAYVAGYMQQAAETQALRQIVRRIEMKEESAKVPSTTAETPSDYVDVGKVFAEFAATNPPPIKTEDFY